MKLLLHDICSILFLFHRELVSLILGSNLHMQDFVHYASTCFKEFGDRVNHWITINEPHSFAIYGYDYGIKAPGRCSLMSRLFYKDGSSSTEPYIAAHNLLLAHSGAFYTYKQHFKVIHGRHKIGRASCRERVFRAV